MSLTDLRIGITALSFEGVLEGLKLGAKGEISFDYVKLIRNVVEKGFKHVELTADLYYVFPQSFSKESIEALKSIQDEEGVSFSVHLPLLSIELDSPIEHIRMASINAVLKPVEELEYLKPKTYVIHIAGPLAAEVNRLEINQFYKQFLFEGLSQNASKSVEQIVSSMRSIGISSRRIALESIEFPFVKTLEIAERFDTSICIDTGHILAGYCGGITLEDALKTSARRLGEIHLHDAYRRKEDDCLRIRDHLPLGSGIMDLASFIKTLRSISFTGPIVFELGLKDAKTSLEELLKASS